MTTAKESKKTSYEKPELKKNGNLKDITKDVSGLMVPQIKG
jgi:hypothetical protein